MEKKILLLGLELNSANLGCEALAYSFLYVLRKIADENDFDFKITLICGDNFQEEEVYGFKASSQKIQLKSFKFYQKYINLCKNADVIFDFTGGDSFTDIYGKWRFFYLTWLKKIAIHYGKKFVMGPQTLGPFKNSLIKSIAKTVMKKSEEVYTRDKISLEYASSIGINANLTTDVAFMLPVAQTDFSDSFKAKRNIGINVSALLWYGGYNHNNDFGLVLDYKQYIEKLINGAVERGYTVHLIPHVLADTATEGDAMVNDMIHNIYSQTVVAPKFKNPMEAKSYMAHCDIFIGARMHATVGAFSMGVPTIAVAYSRKFQGLYNSLDYPYVIDAKKIDTEEAVKTTLNWIDNKDVLKRQLIQSLDIAKRDNTKFINDVKNLIVNS